MDVSRSDIGLADRMKAATHALHAEAERSGFVRDLLRGTATRTGYLRHLAALRVVYAALEAALERTAGLPAIAPLYRPAVFRAAAIASDLATLGGSDVAPVASATAYARHLDALACTHPALLVAHVYTRYLGDLNGGRVVRDRARTSLGLPDAALAFHTFPDIVDLRSFAARYRDAIDAVGDAPGVDVDGVVDEARRAFRRNIEVSVAVARASAAD